MSDGEFVPLEEIPKGGRGIVVYLPPNPGLRNRLIQMGLAPGTPIEVIENPAVGPLIIKVRGATIGIGRGIARRILVKLY